MGENFDHPRCDRDNPLDKTYGSGNAEREAHYPEAGYNLVEIDMKRPPGEALTAIGHSITLYVIMIQRATEFEDYVVYDRHGHAYDQSALHDTTDFDDSDHVDDALETIQSNEGRKRRLDCWTSSMAASPTSPGLITARIHPSVDFYDTIFESH